MTAAGGSQRRSGGRFDGARVVVTGAARGIGEAIARSFAAEGGTIAVVDRLAGDAAAVADALGGVAVTADLADAAGTVRAIDTAIEALGGVDVLVNDAGMFRITPLLDITADEWDLMFAVNTRAMLLTTQVAARSMIAAGRGGKIVNIASMGGKLGAPGQAHYAASKAAVISLTQVSAMELGPHGINVNAVCPGYVPTEMGAATRTQEMIDTWSAKSPLGRLGRPDDVAAMTLFLASAEAAYCTGQAMNVTGGMMMH
jgi:NAD(P)-dependent dehydrogenase (short-subunit alcohol dehydrogenase family)